jgi:hypothetical protein
VIPTQTKKPGDRISLEKRGRWHSGEIVEVLGDPEHGHYLVRWDDGKTTYVYPPQVGETARAAQQPATRSEGAAPEAKPKGRLKAEPGDRLVVHGHYQGQPERDAEILEVRGPDGDPPFLVRWEDNGSVTLIYPGSDVLVEHIVKKARRRSAKQR